MEIINIFFFQYFILVKCIVEDYKSVIKKRSKKSTFKIIMKSRRKNILYYKQYFLFEKISNNIRVYLLLKWKFPLRLKSLAVSQKHTDKFLNIRERAIVTLKILWHSCTIEKFIFLVYVIKYKMSFWLNLRIIKKTTFKFFQHLMLVISNGIFHI